MGMFDEYKYLLTPPIPPLAELPKDRNELWKFMHQLYFSEDSIRTVANAIWEKAGCPNGEDMASDHGYRLNGIKLRDMHWLEAKWKLDVVLETDFDTVWYILLNWRESNSITE